MAEAAAGLFIAFEVISTAVEGGALAGWALTRKTLPLKAKYSCIAQASQEKSPDSLARYSHTINVIDGDLFIFGGQVSKDLLCGNEVHILKLSSLGGLGPQYKAVPAVARDGEDLPAARAGHTACLMDDKIIVFGGYGVADQPRTPLDERGRVWVFNPDNLQWSPVNVAGDKYPTRSCHAAVIHNNKLIIHGGYSDPDSPVKGDTWSFDFASRTWTELPTLKQPETAPFMIATAPPQMALINDKLHVVTASSDSGSQVHILDLQTPKSQTAENTPLAEKRWASIDFRNNQKSLTPEPRQGAGLVSISTGLGRSYLIYLLGSKVDPQSHYKSEVTDHTDGIMDLWANAWALQLPSSDISVSQLKDRVRDRLGMDPHEAEWAEIEVVADTDEDLSSPAKGLGKSHPGPRSDFACTLLDGKRVIVFWGGRDPKGEAQGNGWIVELSI